MRLHLRSFILVVLAITLSGKVYSQTWQWARCHWAAVAKDHLQPEPADPTWTKNFPEAARLFARHDFEHNLLKLF